MKREMSFSRTKLIVWVGDSESRGCRQARCDQARETGWMTNQETHLQKTGTCWVGETIMEAREMICSRPMLIF